MNDNCITKVVVFRRIAMGSLVRRYIVTKRQVKPLLDVCITFPRDYDIVHSSSSLAKGFFPEAHIQMRNKIRIDQGIAIATIWPKYSSEMK